MLEVAPHVTPDIVNRIARSMLSFAGAFGREHETLRDADAHPDCYHPPGPTRPSSITACVPAFVQENGDAVEGGISASGGGGMSTGGHLDGDQYDVSAVQQPGEDDEDYDAQAPPAGCVRCASLIRTQFCDHAVQLTIGVDSSVQALPAGCVR
jgi:hypothetical protein